MAPDRHSLTELHRSTDDATGTAIVAGKVVQTDGIGGFVYGDAASTTEEPFDLGNLGATETLDVATNGTWQRGNLNVACAITVTGFTVDEGLVVLLELTGTGAITWDSDVDFGGADDQPNASGYTAYLLWSSAGDADIKGAKVGGGSPLTVQEEGVALATAATVLNFVGAGVTASGTGATKTITVGGVTTAALAALGYTGGLLIASDHSTPIVFDDILQASDGSDFLYASEP